MNFSTVALAPAAASATNVAGSQTPGAAGNLTLTASPVILDTPRRVLFTPAGAEATNGTIWTVYGTNRSGNVITEVVPGTNSPTTASTVNDFATVTRIAVNKAQAAAVTVGTSSVVSSQWFMVNTATTPINVGVGVVVSGTVNYTVEYTYNDPNALPSGIYPALFPLTALAAKTGSLDGAITTPVWGVRVTLNSFTAPGAVSATFIQAGLA